MPHLKRTISLLRNAFIPLMIILFLNGTTFSQVISEFSRTDTLLVADSNISLNNSPSDVIKSTNSVFDICWVTTCIKSGWKNTDTAFIGYGVEPCDTLYPFIMPVDGKFWRGCTYYHSGWDIGCDYGTPVLASMAGRVRFASYSSGYGKLVIVRHNSGLEVYYAHLSKMLVSADQFVNAGDTIGLVGATGRARGNHLHMEFRLRDQALDIADYYVQNDTVVNLSKIFNNAPQQNNPQSVEYHTIVRGDTLYDLSRRYGTTVTSLCSLNQISKSSTLRIGQKLRIR